MMKTLLSSTKKILDAPLSRCNWYKKAALWPFVVFIGFPLYVLAFCVAILPFVVGGGLLFLQTYLYLQGGEWYSFSALDVATQTVDSKLANEIGNPMLASCAKSRYLLTPGGSTGSPGELCPNLTSWQLWLFHPRSWFGLHEILLPLLNLASLPLLLLLVGLFLWHFFKGLRSSVHVEAIGPLQTGFTQLRHH